MSRVQFHDRTDLSSERRCRHVLVVSCDGHPDLASLYDHALFMVPEKDGPDQKALAGVGHRDDRVLHRADGSGISGQPDGL